MRGQRQEWWAKLQGYFDGSVLFFSEDGRTEREKAPIREFLRYLGVPFTDDDLTVPPKDDAVDVRFREARFQNVERMEPGRRRHDEVRSIAERARTARDVRALEIPRSESVPMGVHELLREVLKALDKKTRKAANRASLDAVVYLNFRGRHLYPAPDVIEEDNSAVARLGWRSVSVLWPPYAVVLCAKPRAPKFLRVKVGRLIRFSGVPWEGTALPAEPVSVASLARVALGSFAAAGYVALGGLVLAARGTRDVIDRLRDRLVREAWVVEAESVTTAGWSIVSRFASVEDATARLGELLRRVAGLAVFDRRRWRLRHGTTQEVVPGELLGC
jgi:hypothetical protein